MTNGEPGASTKLVYARGISLIKNKSLPGIDLTYTATFLSIIPAYHGASIGAVSHNGNAADMQDSRLGTTLRLPRGQEDMNTY
jgi:hypothetical protein